MSSSSLVVDSCVDSLLEVCLSSIENGSVDLLQCERNRDPAARSRIWKADLIKKCPFLMFILGRDEGIEIR